MEPEIAEQFTQARVYNQMARISAAQSVAFMILCGHELNRLHKALGFERGRPSADKSANGCRFKFGDLAERFAGVSERTARNYRAMADAAKKRIPQLNAEELLQTPLAELPELRQQELLQAVHKATDGQTAQQLMWDWGLAKGAPYARGRKPGSGNEPKALSFGEQAALHTEAAERDWLRIDRELVAYRAEFIHLPDVAVEAQIHVLDLALKARRAWLKHRAPHDRDVEEIHRILRGAR